MTGPGGPAGPCGPPGSAGPPGRSGPQRPGPPARPVDVDTGFWLWVTAVPLMMIGYVADLVGSPRNRGPALVYVASGLFTVVLCAIVVAFLILMRAGYRWARTVLASGGLATVVYVGTRLVSVDWPTAVAAVCGVTGIVGSVLIAGGMFLLYRRDSRTYFTR
jgi:hypothetical protein